MIASVECINRRFGFVVIWHFNKTESARAAGFAIRQNANPVHRSIRAKNLPEVVFRRVKAQATYKYILQVTSFGYCRS
jgi:hypothetical protein